MLDYVFLNDILHKKLRCYEILEEGTISSTSDHLPILVELDIDSNPHIFPKKLFSLPAWHRLTENQKSVYVRELSEPLDILKNEQ